MGGLPYPELSDWHPKGKVTTAYDLWNEERGASNRAVIVVDKEGIIRYKWVSDSPANEPDYAEVQSAVAQLG